MDKKDGRILVLGTCLFFALGIGAGVYFALHVPGEWDLPAGTAVDIRATYLKELKYVIFLLISGFLLKKDSLILTCTAVKGFIVGMAALLLYKYAGLRGILVYFAPLQAFSCPALILAGGGGLYACKNHVKTKEIVIFSASVNLLIFFGTVLEAVILKII